MKYSKLFSGIILSALIALCTACGNDTDADTDNNTAEEKITEINSADADMSSVNDFEVWAKDSEADEIERELASAAVTTKTKTSGLSNEKMSGSSATKNPVISGTSAKTQKNASGSKTTAKNGNSSGSKTTAKKNNSSGGKTTAKKAQTTKAATTTKKKSTTAAKTTEPPVVDDTIHIKLNGSSISSSSNKGVSIDGSKVTISAEGKYEFTGTLDNGQIVVNTDKSSKVDIYFNNVNISCGGSAPLYVMSADTCSLHLVDGSSNYVQDTSSNALSACILSKDDLTIKGGGSLSISGYKKHGIKSSNDVKVKNGSLYISCPSTGIYGEDSVQISGGSITIASCKDGIKASNELDASRGYVSVEDGYIDIKNAAGNGIEAVTGVTISGGNVKVHSAKKAVNCDNQYIASGCLSEY